MSKLDGRKNYPELMGKNEADFIKQAKTRWDESTTFLQDTIDRGVLALKAVRGDDDAAWDKDILAKRKTEGRPTLKENMLPSFLNQVEGEFRLNTPSIKVVTGSPEADPDAAEIIQGKIYYGQYRSQAKAIHQDAFEQMVRTGFGAWGMITQYRDDETFEQEPVLRSLDHHSVRWDPTAKLPDLSDKGWVQIYQQMPEEVAKARWPKADFGKSSATNGTNDALWWADKQVGVMEYWYEVKTPKKRYKLEDGSEVDALEESQTSVAERTAYECKVYSCIINGNEVIEGPTEWTITKKIPVFVPTGKKLTVEGKTLYIAFISKDAVETQQLHNYHITGVTETLALQPDAPWKATDEEIENHPEWDDGKKHRVLTFKKDPQRPNGPTREAPPQIGQSQLMMPQYTKQALRDTIGIQKAGLGMESNEKSGVAIRERKEEGDVGSFVFTSNFERQLAFEGRCWIEAIQALDSQPGTHIMLGVDGEQKTKEISKAFDKGRYDLFVTIGPSMTTQRQEARSTMIELLQAAGQANPIGVSAVFPKLVKSMDMPDAHEVAEIFAATLPPELQQRFYPDQKKDGEQPINIPPEMMQQVQQMQMQMQQAMQAVQALQAENEQLKSKAAEKMAEIEAKRELSAAELELKRAEIEGELALKQQEIQSKIELATIELQSKIQRDAEKFAHEIQLKEAKGNGSGMPMEQSGGMPMMGKPSDLAANVDRIVNDAVEGGIAEREQAVLAPIHQNMTAIMSVLEKMTAPKQIRIIRDEQGRIAGAEQITDSGTAE